jgi:hypothetical protein
MPRGAFPAGCFLFGGKTPLGKAWLMGPALEFIKPRFRRLYKIEDQRIESAFSQGRRSVLRGEWVRADGRTEKIFEFFPGSASWLLKEC